MISRILLLSAYDAKSHKLWRERLRQMFPEVAWTQLALPPRNFNWRIRGNSLHWALNNKEELSGDHDLVIATSMVDLSSLRGLVPELASIPSIVYFHENQFAYPGNLQREENIEPILVPIYSALCADKIVFNSKFNKVTFVEGVRSLFNRLPDKIPVSAIEKFENSEIVPVPVSFPFQKPVQKNSNDYLEVIWNHRWEYDKGPDLLLTIVKQATESNLPIRFHIVGESFRQQPEAFKHIQELLQQHHGNNSIDSGEFGFIDNEVAYYELLANCDVAISTALHDFQGLAIQEACFAGCTPLAPQRLVYPEYLPEDFLYSDSGDDDEAAAREVIERLQQWLSRKQRGDCLPKVNLDHFSSESLRKNYGELFEFAS